MNHQEELNNIALSFAKTFLAEEYGLHSVESRWEITPEATQKEWIKKMKPLAQMHLDALNNMSSKLTMSRNQDNDTTV